MRRILIAIIMMVTMKSFSQNSPSVVPKVDINRYTGTWYEIARLPNSFEKNLKCITATYTLRSDGKITVLNRGHRIDNPSKVSSAKGVAWIPDKNVPAKLKVRFFWPFSGDYWIISLDENYRHVLVGGPSFRYLWILCRDKVMDGETYEKLIKKAASEGFDITPVIKVDHDCN
jgi:apolipoprotein D and lipocalin family protein